MTQNNQTSQNIQVLANALLALIGLYNQAALYFGWAHLEVVNEQVTALVSVVYNAVVGLWIFWKNNPTTQAGRLGQAVINRLKAGTLTDEQVTQLVDSKPLGQ